MFDAGVDPLGEVLASVRSLVAEAFRSGRLSEAQAREIAAVAAEVPEAQEQLVEAAGKLTLRGLQEECRRVEAAAAVDEDERYRQVHRKRRIRAWVDRYNVGRLSATMTPDIDHRNSFGRTRVTKLEDLALLCPFHHYLKTFWGYTYRGGPGTWEWIPPENRDEDLSELSKIITSARRC
jgi:hypothetical protein